MSSGFSQGDKHPFTMSQRGRITTKETLSFYHISFPLYSLERLQIMTQDKLCVSSDKLIKLILEFKGSRLHGHSHRPVGSFILQCHKVNISPECAVSENQKHVITSTTNPNPALEITFN